jgi:cysteinyl-tRNA synthetase
MLKLYNALNRKKGTFKPIADKEVKMYACGPTVYYYAHIGNMKTYLSEDVIKRVLIHKGYRITHVMNITDVGHLVGDGDVGEDKVVSSAKTEHKTAYQIAEHYTKTFLEDSKLLNILPPDITPKATEHINDMIALISTLEAKGYTYKAENGIYYDTSKFKDYGELTGSTFKELNEQLRGGARVERVAGLRNITDFAVWRFSKPEQTEMVWDTKWGKGFPGWHIECSAMSMKYLGTHFDLHFGGIDHIAVHHTNEIAQSDAAVGSRVVNCWMHMNFLTVDGMKMSKSLNNIYTVKDIMEKQHDALAIRFFMISGHYRQQLNFTFEALASAENTLKGIYAFLTRMAEVENKIENTDTTEFKKKIGNFKKTFFKELDDDINMPNALANMHALMNEANSRLASNKLNRKEARVVFRVMLEFDEILGLDFASYSKSRKSALGKEVKALIDQREDARLKKDYAKADDIRKILKDRHNVVLEDTKDGLKWRIE